ncbi:MAG: hypothetical protein J6S48_04130 [Bacteroidales bacterium]|nr:hypothetical protein [Bacteroidales bacterium]
MKPDETTILKLREMVEASVSRKMKTPADFQFLTGVIQERCKETLGVTTLKRIWGYVEGYDTTRYSTLSILARCVGFHDWDDFLVNHNRSGESSNMVIGRVLYPDDIPAEGYVRIAWSPDRRVLLRHFGDGHFVVTESENSKLKPGDSFHCSCFIIGEPLYLDNFVRDANPPTLFVVGNKGGLTEVRRERE